MRPFPRSQDSSNKLSLGALVEYQQHGKLCLGVIVALKRDKFSVRTLENSTIDLAAARITLLEQETGVDVSDESAVLEFLQRYEASVVEHAGKLNLGEVWELLLGEERTVSAQRIIELLSPNTVGSQLAASRRLLFGEQVYFKRQKKTETFEVRNQELVEELIRQKEIEARKEQARARWVKSALQRLDDPQSPLPEPIEHIEALAAQGKSAPQAKEAALLVDSFIDAAGLTAAKSLSKRANDVLVALKHFSPHELLTPYRLGRPLRFSAEVSGAVSSIGTAEALSHSLRDDLQTITIDGVETRDFDDALSFQRLDNATALVGIHISDVASFLRSSPILTEAAIRRGTSIYCPTDYFPMLPTELSENSFSLKEGEQRAVLSCYLQVNEDFEVLESSFVPERIIVQKRATYEEVDQCLCEDSSPLTPFAEMLRFLWELSSHSELQRIDQGAAQFMRRELHPEVSEDFKVEMQASDEDTPARKLVSELMILANQAAADFAYKNEFALLFRAQESPTVDHTQQGLDIPEGPARDFFQRSFFKRSQVQVQAASHFGLGVQRYAQVTSPIRRVVDLINQTQLISFVQEGSAQYSESGLAALLEEIQKGLDEAFQIQRESNRYWLLEYLKGFKGKSTQAIVLKVDGPRPLAEIAWTHSIFPFKALKGKNPAPGDKVELILESVDPRRDAITFKQVS